MFKLDQLTNIRSPNSELNLEFAFLAKNILN